MGTSKGYGMPTGGEWTPLKTEATKFVKNANADVSESSERLVSRFISAYGGSENIARGSGGGRGAAGGTTGKSARRVGAVLGRFLTDVSAHGLAEGLRRNGLADLVGKTAAEILAGLIEHIAGPANTLEDDAARFALTEMKGEILAAAETFEEADACLTSRIEEEGVFALLVDFFAKYVYRLFCINFYEDWQKKAGTKQASAKLGDVKTYIFSKITRVAKDGSFEDWSGNKAERLSQSVLQATLRVFEVAE